jgi:hypothetical protein
VWAVARSLFNSSIVQWTSTGWKAQASQPASAPDTLWANTGNDVWAWVPSVSKGLTHWDGQAWSPPSLLPSSKPQDNIAAFWSDGANDVWAVGEYGVIAHWDGTTWSRLTFPNAPNVALKSVSGTGLNDVWMAGFDPDSFRIIVIHWNGTALELAGSFDHQQAMPSSVFASRPGEVWLGSRARWNGNSWQMFPGDTATTTMWGSGPNDVWMIDERQIIRHWDGTQISTVLALTGSEQLTSMSGSSATDVWAVGLSGETLRFHIPDPNKPH